ncbi:amidohydrolase family protein [Yinghuangia aomiensis]
MEERRSRGGLGRFAATSVKIMQDGIAENFTAAMLAPYLDKCGCATANSGLSFVDPALLGRAVTELDRLGFQVHFHALGDRAVREALDAIAEARTANGTNDNRHHLAHLQVVDPADLERFAAPPAPPPTSRRSGRSTRRRWTTSPSRSSARTAPRCSTRSATSTGPSARLVAGSDWPVSSPNPLWRHPRRGQPHDPRRRAESCAAPTRPPRKPFYLEQSLTPAQAFRACTSGTAWVNHLDDVTGTIEPGKYADLAVPWTATRSRDRRRRSATRRWSGPTSRMSRRTPRAERRSSLPGARSGRPQGRRPRPPPRRAAAATTHQNAPVYAADVLPSSSPCCTSTVTIAIPNDPPIWLSTITAPLALDTDAGGTVR